MTDRELLVFIATQLTWVDVSSMNKWELRIVKKLAEHGIMKTVENEVTKATEYQLNVEH